MTAAEKLRLIRIADVIIIAPLILIAAANKNLPVNLRIALLFIGILTFAYNLDNLIKEDSIRN